MSRRAFIALSLSAPLWGSRSNDADDVTKGTKTMSTTTNKAYNATRDGQVAMAHDAASRAPAFQMNKIIKSKGGIGWSDDMIASADPVLLRSIKEDLLEEYNAIISRP